MKKTNLKLKKCFLLTIVILFIGLILQSCEKQDIAVIEPQSKEFTMKDGILTFNTVADFINVKGRVANFSKSEREKWEKEIGFKSQKTIYSEIIQAENEIDAVNQAKFSHSEAKRIDPALLHSDLYNKYLKAGVIRVIDAGTENEYWDMPFTQKKVMEIVNEKGLYAVSNKIFSVNGDVVKYISDGDFSKIPALLSASIVDKTTGIEFLNPNTHKNYSPGLINTGWISESGKRIALQVNLEVYMFTSYPSMTYYYYHEIYVQNQEKNWLGNWKYKAAETWINATWRMNVFANDKVSFSNTYSFHGLSSDFKGSIDPETGANPTYRYVFNVTSPDPEVDDIESEPYWDWNNTVFTAVRIGGQAGITATIPY